MRMWPELIPTLSPLTIVLRGTIVYFVVSLLFRVVPKRHVGANSPNDLLALVIIGGLIGDSISTGSEKPVDFLLLGAVVLFWDFSFNFLEFHFPRFARLTVERPTVIVKDGRYLRRAMRSELITKEEVLSCLRRQGVESIEQVARATVESNGEITVIAKTE